MKGWEGHFGTWKMLDRKPFFNKIKPVKLIHETPSLLGGHSPPTAAPPPPSYSTVLHVYHLIISLSHCFPMIILCRDVRNALGNIESATDDIGKELDRQNEEIENITGHAQKTNEELKKTTEIAKKHT